MKFLNVNAVALQSVLDLIKEVSYGKVDAILVDGSVAQQYQATNDDLSRTQLLMNSAPPQRSA